MKRRVLPVLLLCAAAAAPAPSPADSVVSFAAPAGWTRSDYANSGGVDPVIAFEDGEDRITVAVYGAPGSAYKTPADFLSGPAASTMGRPPERAGAATVAGRKTGLYRHQIPVQLGDPHLADPRAPSLGPETFCVLPPGRDGRFAVLSYFRQTPVPDLHKRGEKAWKSFLKSVRRPKAPKP